MILAVTMNPSVDISYPLEQLQINDVNRIENVQKTAGGKGLNVARVVKQMGEEVVATGVLGGTTGEYICQELTKSEMTHDFLKISQESRNCIAILHEGLQTEILEAGPTLTEEDSLTFLKKFTGLLSEASLVTISGSLPKGLAPGFYQQMIKISHGSNIPVILDTSGEALKQVLLHEGKPLVIKPNISELSQLLGENVDSDVESLKKALNHELFKGIDWIVVSLGSEGAFVRQDGEYYKVTIPKINVVNPVGSGDATVAGLAYALKQNQPVEAVLKTAMTTGMLNTMESGTGYIDRSKFEGLYQLVEVTKIEK